MKVWLHRNPTGLPFGSNLHSGERKEEKVLFKPKMGGYVLYKEGKDPFKNPCFLKDTYMYPILKGLRKVKSGNLEAHLYFPIESNRELWHFPYCMLLQLVTVTEDGAKHNVYNVETRSYPYDYFEEAKAAYKDMADDEFLDELFWFQLFNKKLEAIKNDIQKNLDSADEKRKKILENHQKKVSQQSDLLSALSN